MERTKTIATLLVGAALAIAGCASDEATRYERGPVWVEVQNANLHDADVYVLSGGQQHRLGLVPTNGRERFRVAPRLVAPPGELRVAADLLASSGSFVSPVLRIEAGDVVRLVVQPDVNTSYVQLR